MENCYARSESRISQRKHEMPGGNICLILQQMRESRRRIMGIITASHALTIKSALDKLVVYEYYWVYPGHEWRKQ